MEGAADRFMKEFRERAESYIDGHGGGGSGLRSGELGTLAFAFVVVLAICVGVPLVICVIVGRAIEPGADLAFTVVASAVLALAGVAAFDHNKRLDLRYAGFRKDKKLKAMVREMLADDEFAGSVKRAKVGDLAAERAAAAQRRNVVLRRVWKVAVFVFIAVLAFGLAWTPSISGFTLTVWWALVPLAVFIAFEAANCANERQGAFYDFATTIL